MTWQHPGRIGSGTMNISMMKLYVLGGGGCLMKDFGKYDKEDILDFFHCPIKIISRNKGHSTVAASAYISGTRMENTWDGTIHDYTRKQHIIYTEVLLPENAPPEYADRAVLWNSVEWNEKARDAQLARSVQLALPAELNHEQNIALIRTESQTPPLMRKPSGKSARGFTICAASTKRTKTFPSS